MDLQSEIEPSTPASFHNFWSPNIAIGLNSNEFHKFWWILICRHPYMKQEENEHKTQYKYTENRTLRHTYKKGPFVITNRRTKPGHTCTWEEDPPVSHPGKGGGERRCQGVGRTRTESSPVPLGRWFYLILSNAVIHVSTWRDGGNRPFKL